MTDFEAVRVAKTGEERQVWVTCAPVRGPHGNIVAISNIHRDITQARNAEEARKIIAREVIHRAKNMLAIVAAIQRQTARNATSLEQFNQKFGERIRSLSASTDLLVSGDWTSVSLADLVKSQLEPFLADSSATINVDGPAVLLQPQAVQVVGMALHELSTNSAKYGAMQTNDGKIDISWKHVVDGTTSRVALGWVENGIDVDLSNAGIGFGKTVLTSLARSMLDAEVDYRLGHNSVFWTMTVSSDHFIIGE